MSLVAGTHALGSCHIFAPQLGQFMNLDGSTIVPQCEHLMRMLSALALVMNIVWPLPDVASGF